MSSNNKTVEANDLAEDYVEIPSFVGETIEIECIVEQLEELFKKLEEIDKKEKTK